MFNYIFPIFCFGLVITGIVFLGLLEAAKHVKVVSSDEDERAARPSRPDASLPRKVDSARSL